MTTIVDTTSTTSASSSTMGPDGFHQILFPFIATPDRSLPESGIVLKTTSLEKFSESLKTAQLYIHALAENKIAIPFKGFVNLLHVTTLSVIATDVQDGAPAEAVIVVNITNRDAMANIILSTDHADCGKLTLRVPVADIVNFTPGSGMYVTVDFEPATKPSEDEEFGNIPADDNQEVKSNIPAPSQESDAPSAGE